MFLKIIKIDHFSRKNVGHGSSPPKEKSLDIVGIKNECLSKLWKGKEVGARRGEFLVYNFDKYINQNWTTRRRLTHVDQAWKQRFLFLQLITSI